MTSYLSTKLHERYVDSLHHVCVGHSLCLKTFSTDWIFGPQTRNGRYHIPIVRSQLTRNLGNMFSDLRDEIMLAFDEYIPPTEGTSTNARLLPPTLQSLDLSLALTLSPILQNGPKSEHSTP